MNQHERIAVVTGATKGVGRGIARALAESGARVFATGRSAPGHGHVNSPFSIMPSYPPHTLLTRTSLGPSRRIRSNAGLIVNISHWAAQKHIGNVAYGVSKAATDKMTADMAFELERRGVTVVSLYPGMVRTEKVMEAAQWLDLSNSESPDFVGRAVVALAEEYGFTDLDGTVR